jgi:hypothetical protein
MAMRRTVLGRTENHTRQIDAEQESARPERPAYGSRAKTSEITHISTDETYPKTTISHEPTKNCN